MAGREAMRRLANRSIARGDSKGWFEELYQGAKGVWESIPWVNSTPNQYLLEWLDSERSPLSRRACLVVGCGLGDDAEALSERGFNVVAFDISPTAIKGCRSRFPASRVDYVVADLFALLPEWIGRFDLVFEANTLQVLPAHARLSAVRALASAVALDGRLLVICRAREDAEPEGEIPWPLTRKELGVFMECGLTEIGFENVVDEETPPVRRFRAVYERHPKKPRRTTCGI